MILDDSEKRRIAPFVSSHVKFKYSACHAANPSNPVHRASRVDRGSPSAPCSSPLSSNDDSQVVRNEQRRHVG